MDDLAGSLQARFRLLVWLALAEITLVALFFATGGATGGLIASLAMLGANAIALVGIPILGWHFRIPYAARVLFPVFSFTNVNEAGQDPRSLLWFLAVLPVIMFFLGWLIDWTLTRRDDKPGILRRLGFSFLWTLLLYGSLNRLEIQWNNFIEVFFAVVGIALVWWRLPSRWAIALDRVDRRERLAIGFRKGGAWLASRATIVALILLPAVVFLDLLDLPGHLREELGSPPSPSMIYWLRDGHAFDLSKLTEREIYAAAPDGAGAVVEALQKLRIAPRDPAALDALRKLGKSRISTPSEFFDKFGFEPLFYVEPGLAGTDRGTGGILFTLDPVGRKLSELRSVELEDIEKLEIQTRQATIVLLANSVLVILILGGNSGRSAAAWWLALYLVGTSMGWASESLGLVVEKVRFVMWRNYGDEAYGALLLGAHGFLLYVLRFAEWLVREQICHAGLWVSLCWPSRPGRLIHTVWDRFWYQFPKIVLVAGILFLLRLGSVSAFPDGGLGFMVWIIALPLFLVGAGVWMRRRAGRSRTMPRAARLAAAAFILRGWVPVFTSYEVNWGTTGSWIGIAAVVLVVVATVLLVLSLERGTFLVPPHVEGQLWLIGVASLPFIECIVGKPLEAWMKGTSLFTGSAVSWVVLGGAIWLIEPLGDLVGARLARLWARGLDRINAAQAELIAWVTRPPGETGALSKSPLSLAHQLIDDIGVREAVAWRQGKDGSMQAWYASEAEPHILTLSDGLATELARGGRALRLEEMRDSWEWVDEADELERLFERLGDVFVIPLPYEDSLLGLLTAPDCEENRFLLRPVVSKGLGRVLATALMMTHQKATEMIQESKVAS